MSWETFLKAHWEAIAATDFFSVEVLTRVGLVRYFVLFVIEQGERGEKVRASEPEQPLHRVEQFLGDIRNEEYVRRAVNGVDVVFQAVSIIDWNPRKPDLLYDVNVKGNHHVIKACIDFGVKKLIYTSSIDVVFESHCCKWTSERKRGASHMFIACGGDLWSR